MRWWHRFVLRRNAESQLDAELRDHLDRQTADYVQQGLPEVEARRRAAANFGGLQQAKEYCRDVRRGNWLRDLATDIRYGARMLAHQRMFTVVVVLSLALGIGANAAIFTLVNSLLLRSLPVREPQRLMLLDKGSWTNPIWEQIRDRQHQLFDGAAAWGDRSLDFAIGGQVHPVNGLLVSGDFFSVFGVPMALGRPIDAANDDRHGSPQAMVAVLSHDFWQRQFGGDVAVLGRTVSLNHHSFVVVGVATARFMGPMVGHAFDVAVPLATTDLLVKGPESQLEGRSTWWLEIVARLKPGQTAEAAMSALRGVQPQIREATLPDGWPPDALQEYLRDGLSLVPAAQGPGYVRDRYQQPLTIIMAVVGLVLLIACANIANLMLARANSRRHELTMRLALGASTGRIARQLLTESVMLAALGALVGFGFAQWGSRLLVAQFASQSDALTLDLTPDWRVLAFTTLVALATALLFGIVPALRARSLAPIEALKEHGRGVGGGRRGLLASPLVILQIALSLVLVVGAGLFMRTFVALAGRDLGFEADPIVLVNVDLSSSNAPREQWGALFMRLKDAAANVAGVRSAAFSPLTPVSGQGWNSRFEFPDLPGLSDRERSVFLNAVTPGWFATYGARVLTGRDFTTADTAGGRPVAIVNEAFARKYFAGGNPLGRLLKQTPRPQENHPAIEIVGLVNDIAYRSVRDAPPPTIFLPVAQLPDRDDAFPSGAISVRAAIGNPDALTRSLGAALSAVDPNVSIRFRLLSDQVSAGIVRERVLAMLSAFFGGLALLLAGIGLYGVTSYAVSMRRTEIGLRMALGADAGNVVAFVMRRVALLVGLGVALGTAISLWVGRFVSSLLFGLEARDITTLAIAAAILVAVGALAAWIPAWRATRIDPIVVLREG